jgi:hypothetical protein
MHNPGICGVILAASGEGHPAAEGDAPPQDQGRKLEALIEVLNEKSDLVLVTLGPDDQHLAPVIWAKAAYSVDLTVSADSPAALRTALQEVLNRGRDTALVISLGAPRVAAETIESMVAAYCASGDDVWAVIPEAEVRPAQPRLLGRFMIDAMLRRQDWRTVEEVLMANLPHVRRLAAAESIA